MRMALEAALLCAATAAVCVLLRSVRPEFAFAAALAGGTGALLLLVPPVGNALEEMRALAERTGLSAGGVLAQACLAGFAGDLLASLCRDAGENALAARVELCARVALTALSLPLLGELVGSLSSLSP